MDRKLTGNVRPKWTQNFSVLHFSFPKNHKTKSKQRVQLQDTIYKYDLWLQICRVHITLNIMNIFIVYN